ncbi:MAG TPA: hypothetical protein VKH35_10685 [Thermoanaerobaculia bacterium]|nr:hypothetical protein [Thermoanaerobaculia bacterium]
MRWKFAAVAVALSVCPLFAKSLYWSSLGVSARLDAKGRLTVSERQSMVFDGDWNGGERSFNLRPGQQLDVVRISRVEKGQTIVLTRGDLSKVDHWDFSGPATVRWRSRRATDPPFHDQHINYQIDYLLSNILDQSGAGIRLNHDFSFPDRSGVIQNFSLRLMVDPVWKGIESPLVIRRQNLRPGDTVIVDRELTYAGAGAPTGVHVAPTTAERAVLPGVMLLAGIVLSWSFYRGERQKGRFDPLPPLSIIDDHWLEANVFRLSPEAAGAAWDETIGAAEVGAILARMAQEKKITTWTVQDGNKPILHMKLNVDWSTLPDGEQKLVEALFLGKTETDTKRIADHYKSSGFSPEHLIRDWVNGQLANVPQWSDRAPAAGLGVTLCAVAAVLLSIAGVNSTRGTASGILFAAIFAAVFGIGLAALALRKRMGRGALAAPVVALVVLAIAATSCWVAVADEVSWFFTITAFLDGLAMAALIVLVSRTRDSAVKLAFRRQLAAARRFFESQLRTPTPHLRDEWYPYLIAMGLGTNVDHWFHSFAGGSAFGRTAASDFTSSSSSSSTSSGSSWTGGGGAFGGAGASGAWAAMSTVASGVSSPSSSGGSSGGGGGGGW